MLLRALLAAGVVAVAAPAFAQTAQQPAEGKLMRACGPDVQNFCSGVTPGGGRIASCLRPHMRQLSPQCKGQLVESHARRHEQMQQQQPQ